MVAGPPLCACFPLVLHRDVMDDRSTIAPLAVAPIPPEVVRAADLSVRQLYATLIDGRDDRALGTSATGNLRTDFALGARFSRFVGFRLLGSLDYGDRVGNRASALGYGNDTLWTAGAGLLLGRWGIDEPWSIHVELDTRLAALRSQERWGHEESTCTAPDVCTPWVRVSTDVLVGNAYFPAVGLSVDATGALASWIRLGGGLSIQSLVVRGMTGAGGWEPVATARIFVELRLFDVSAVIEVQQALSSDLVFAPFLALSLRGAAFDGPGSPARLARDAARRRAEAERIAGHVAAVRARWEPRDAGVEDDAEPTTTLPAPSE